MTDRDIELLATTRSSRLLQLVDLNRALEKEAPLLASSTGFTDSYVALRALNAERLGAVVDYPTFGTWLRTSRALLGRDAHRRLPTGHIAAHLSRLARFAAVGGLAARLDARLSLILGPSAVVNLPGSGYAMSFGARSAGETVSMDVSAHRVRATCGAEVGELELSSTGVFIGTGVCVELPRSGGIVIDAADDDRLGQAGGVHGLRLAEVLALSLAMLRRKLDETLAAVRRQDPTLTELLQCLVPVRDTFDDGEDLSHEWPLGAAPLMIDSPDAGSALAMFLDRQLNHLWAVGGESGPASIGGGAVDGRLQPDEVLVARWLRSGGSVSRVPTTAPVLSAAESKVIDSIPSAVPRQPNLPGENVVRQDALLRDLGRLSVVDPERYDAVRQQTRSLPTTAFQALMTAHLAYIDRDFGTALAAYDRCIQDSPEDLDRWTDLAFTLRHLGDEACANFLTGDCERVATASACLQNKDSVLSGDSARPVSVAFVDWIRR